MHTTIFEWWRKSGRTLKELAETLHYSSDYIYRVAGGQHPITESFVARCVLHLGDETRFLFFDSDVGPLSTDHRYQSVAVPDGPPPSV